MSEEPTRVTVTEEPAIVEIEGHVGLDITPNESDTVESLEAAGIKAETVQRSVDEARRNFFVQAAQLGGLVTAEGKPSQAKIHKLLELECGERLHDQPQGTGCKALSERLATLQAIGGVSAAEAWDVVTGELLAAHRALGDAVTLDAEEGQVVQPEMEMEGVDGDN